MKKSLEEDLKKNHPEILKEIWGDPKKTCMAWGMECDDGWYSLLDSAMSKLDFAVKSFTTAGSPTTVVASQVKEKFGTLSFYCEVDSVSDIAKSIIRDIVRMSEIASSSTCEITGTHGSLCVSGGWLKTLCREKAKELGFRPTKPEVEEYWAKIESEQLQEEGGEPKVPQTHLTPPIHL